jgi:hypothetical protein
MCYVRILDTNIIHHSLVRIVGQRQGQDSGIILITSIHALVDAQIDPVSLKDSFAVLILGLRIPPAW